MAMYPVESLNFLPCWNRPSEWTEQHIDHAVTTLTDLLKKNHLPHGRKPRLTDEALQQALRETFQALQRPREAKEPILKEKGLDFIPFAIMIDYEPSFNPHKNKELVSLLNFLAWIDTIEFMQAKQQGLTDRLLFRSLRMVNLELDEYICYCIHSMLEIKEFYCENSNKSIDRITVFTKKELNQLKKIDHSFALLQQLDRLLVNAFRWAFDEVNHASETPYRFPKETDFLNGDYSDGSHYRDIWISYFGRP